MTTRLTSFSCRTTLAGLAALTLAGVSPFAAAATIGIMAPLSGPQAIVGQDQVDGFMLAVEQLKGQQTLLENIADRMIRAIRGGKKILWCGNGGRGVRPGRTPSA